MNDLGGSILIRGAKESAERQMQHFLAYIRSDVLADIRSVRRSNPNPYFAQKLKLNEFGGSILISGAKYSADRKMQHFLAYKLDFLPYISSDFLADVRSDRRSNRISK